MKKIKQHIKMIVILCIVSIINIAIFNITILSNYNNTFALTYQENVPVEFTFEPTISINLSYADLIIEDLAPGSASDSNIITVTTSTNNVAGHTLSASVGNGTTYTDTKLVNNSAYFTSLATNADISGLNNLTSGYWGYSFSTDGSTWSNYSGLPYYNTAPKELASTNTNGTSSLEFKIAASADNWQASGEYNNVINFYAITNPAPVSFYDAFASAGKTKHNGYYKMQDMTTSICNAVQVLDEDSQTQLIDIRDGNIYWVAKLQDNRCWLLDNLRLDPTITNLSVENTNATAKAIENYLNGGNPDKMNGWSDVKISNMTSGMDTFDTPIINSNYKNDVLTRYGNGSRKIGVYYNYCAATVGTYCYKENEGVGDSEYDICPLGWRIPTGGASGEYQILRNAYLDHNETFFLNLSSFVLAGGITSYRYDYDTYGYYWSSTHYDYNQVHTLNVGVGEDAPNQQALRNRGRSLRCLAK